ncbi:MAG: pyruvate dehydrogenase (acetyl-transferring) E1 component subunit alpha [Phycisphaerales bacterium]|nr:pyruvate dehydrogenase (acetyl-transferring) E1 component subunit alpha [Phycisphaerales bacterium]
MAAQNPEKQKTTSSEEVVSPNTPSAMDTSRIDLGHIEVLQILNEYGEVDKGLEPDFSNERLLEVYRAMVLARAFDKRMMTMQRQGRMGTFAPNIGQEACIIGQVTSLTEDDWFAPSYRSFGAQIMRGWPMEHLMRLWAGFHDGFPPPNNVNDLPFSIVIGSHVLPAVGIGMGMKYKKKNNCVVVNYGDGASSQGAVSEALNFAAVYQAPVVFICENNGWAISTPTHKQTANEILASHGVAHGMLSIRVDGNDILAMMCATKEATDRARAGEGPTFIEAVTFRMSLHTTADDPTVYRNDEEVKVWEARCPMARFETYLKNKGVLDTDSIEQTLASCEEEVIKARDTFYEMPPADPTEIFEHLYETFPMELQKQRAEYMQRLRQKGVGE